MSAFKRRDASTQPKISGTKLSPTNALPHVSSGSAALDDLLSGSAGGRGGMGMSAHTLNLVIETDPHSSYSDILLRYYLSQGLVAHHNILSVGLSAASCMWIPASQQTPESDNEDAGLDHKEGRGDSRIAWRYANMKRFETSVNNTTDGAFLTTFDLTQCVPEHVSQRAKEKGLLEEIDSNAITSYAAVLQRIEAACERQKRQPHNMLRIVVRNVGSWEYGPRATDEVTLYKFLFKLRTLARKTPHTTIFASTQSHNLGKTLQRLLYVADAAIALESFSDAPHRARAFAPNHGLLHMLALPALHSLTPPSDRHSVLRGGLVAGDNNLAFKLRRRRLVVETLHLDVEGGVGERRTTPSKSSAGVQETSERVRMANMEHEHQEDCDHGHDGGNVQIETSTQKVRFGDGVHDESSRTTTTTKKGPRRVAFQSDKPELYEF